MINQLHYSIGDKWNKIKMGTWQDSVLCSLLKPASGETIYLLIGGCLIVKQSCEFSKIIIL